MNIVITDKSKVLTPDEGKTLYNASIDVYSDSVTMPLNGDETQWVDTESRPIADTEALNIITGGQDND